MSISSAMNASVAGLNANAMRLATISDNISNSGTYGYKRAETEFSSMVISSGAGSGIYSAGGVRSTPVRLVEERGGLVGTGNALDLAISGRGMLPVLSQTALVDGRTEGQLMMTRSGSFRADAEGVLRTESGLVLLGWPADDNGIVPNMPHDSAAGLEPVVINMNQPAGGATTVLGLSANLPAAATVAGATFGDLPMSVEYYGNLGTNEALDITFTPVVPANGSSNEWVMSIRDRASGTNPIGEYRLTFDDTRGGGGTLLSVNSLSGGAYDPATGQLALTVAGGPLHLRIGQLGEVTGMTQLAGSFAPGNISRDGAPISAIAAVEVDPSGYVVATYESGYSRRLYQVPVVDVPNPNGLTALGNQAYQVSRESGSFVLWRAGNGPSGAIEGYAREASTTDVAQELTTLIQTQRAYSSNAKVIQTVDEMLQETTNIKR